MILQGRIFRNSIKMTKKMLMFRSIHELILTNFDEDEEKFLFF